VLKGIGDEIRQHLRDPSGIGPRLRQIKAYVNFQPVPAFI